MFLFTRLHRLCTHLLWYTLVHSMWDDHMLNVWESGGDDTNCAATDSSILLWCGLSHHHGLSAVLWHKLMCVVVHMYIVEPGSHYNTKPGPPGDDLESVKGLDIHFHRRHFVWRKHLLKLHFVCVLILILKELKLLLYCTTGNSCLKLLSVFSLTRSRHTVRIIWTCVAL